MEAMGTKKKQINIKIRKMQKEEGLSSFMRLWNNDLLKLIHSKDNFMQY